MWELEISHFRELHPKYGIYKPSGLLPEDTTHRTTACILPTLTLRRSPTNKARMYYFSIRTRILQRNLVKLSNPTRVLPKFFVLQNRKKNRIP